MMRGNVTNESHPLQDVSIHSSYRFERLCQQLKNLSPDELRSLQNEIHCSLQSAQERELLTHEEREVIASLF
jgi:hypothetical protein